jgi:hypothetical protein
LLSNSPVGSRFLELAGGLICLTFILELSCALSLRRA